MGQLSPNRKIGVALAVLYALIQGVGTVSDVEWVVQRIQDPKWIRDVTEIVANPPGYVPILVLVAAVIAWFWPTVSRWVGLRGHGGEDDTGGDGAPPVFDMDGGSLKGDGVTARGYGPLVDGTDLDADVKNVDIRRPPDGDRARDDSENNGSVDNKDSEVSENGRD